MKYGQTHDLSTMDELLFPYIPSAPSNAWSTCSSVSNPNVCRVDLDDSILGVHKINSRTHHNIVIPPSAFGISPHKAWEATYPARSINPANSAPGGFGFYLSGPKGFQNGLKSATEVMFSYSVMFASDWEWVKGGKLPGLCEIISFQRLSHLKFLQSEGKETLLMDVLAVVRKIGACVSRSG